MDDKSYITWVVYVVTVMPILGHNSLRGEKWEGSPQFAIKGNSIFILSWKIEGNLDVFS